MKLFLALCCFLASVLINMRYLRLSLDLVVADLTFGWWVGAAVSFGLAWAAGLLFGEWTSGRAS